MGNRCQTPLRGRVREDGLGEEGLERRTLRGPEVLQLPGCQEISGSKSTVLEPRAGGGEGSTSPACCILTAGHSSTCFQVFLWGRVLNARKQPGTRT